MKIRLITFHTPKNYGAVLQAYSLMSYLKRYSDDVEIIDYNTPSLRAKYPVKAKSTTLKQFVYNMLMLPSYRKKKKKFRKFECFVAENLALTKRYESLTELLAAPPDADIALTGSDQVFNPLRNEEERKVFYLDFIPSGTKKIAYAASFGVNAVPEDKKNEISEYLKSFDFISVRENSGVGIVKDLTGQTASEVLDPVFLNDANFWRKIVAPYKKKFKNYLFYYRLMNSAESDAAARKIAKEKKLKLVVMTDGFLKWHADNVLRDVGPKEFLYLMDNADYIVTDSFHGVAFSLVFEKQFYFCDTNPKTNGRGLDLLQKSGIVTNDYANIETADDRVNYIDIKHSLSDYIDSSKKFINNSLGGKRLD